MLIYQSLAFFCNKQKDRKILKKRCPLHHDLSDIDSHIMPQGGGKFLLVEWDDSILDLFQVMSPGCASIGILEESLVWRLSCHCPADEESQDLGDGILPFLSGLGRIGLMFTHSRILFNGGKWGGVSYSTYFQ